MNRCIVMFSGGLDSTMAVHLLKGMGLDILALHFVLPFESGVGLEHTTVRQRAAALGVPIRVEEEGQEYLEMVKNPRFGYGKNANPCIDCRIHRLRKARVIMEQEGAGFVATGEVLGQRPMSQHAHALRTIEKRSGLDGLLLRPLCAQLLNPTIPEEKGWVDRGRLLSISGRGRKAQLSYAAQYGLFFSAPAGGCILTHQATAQRYLELSRHDPDFTLGDFKLLAYGRHFRLDSGAKLVVGRDESENNALQHLAQPDDRVFSLVGMEGPLAILRGATNGQDTILCGAIVARFSRARTLSQAAVRVVHGSDEEVIDVVPANDQICDIYRIGPGSGACISGS